MLRLSRLIILAFLLTVAYGLWPLYSALQIRQAVIAGDTAMLARKVQWEAVRTTLKSSLSPETIAKLAADPQAPKPTLWQRIKAVVAPHMADTVIDRYVTPENLPTLLGYRKTYRETVRPALGLPEAPTPYEGTALGGTAIDRFAAFWSRVRRAVFYSFTEFEMEVEDKYRPGRRYIGTLELIDYDWKLTKLIIIGEPL